jgi:hypothetical protein
LALKPGVIAVASTGSVPRKKDTPAGPISTAEQIESTHEAFEAGASLVHIPVRNDDETPSSSPERFGAVRWPPGRRLASGRSGNHTAHGWFVAAGPGIEPGPTSRVYDAAELIPNAFEWLGAPPPVGRDWGTESGEQPPRRSLR